MQPHTSFTSPLTHRCLEQPGSKENNKQSKCTCAFFFPHKYTRTERSAWVTVSLADTGAGVRFGWLKQREECFKASAQGWSLPRRLPQPPSTSLHIRDRFAFPLGVLSLQLCLLLAHPTLFYLPLISSIMHVALPSLHPSSFLFSDASWSRPVLFACVGEAVLRLRLEVTVSQSQQQCRGSAWGEDQ